MVGLTRTQRAAAAVAILAATGLAAAAQELVYKPVNPSFGGDSFNSAHLLGIANAQNDYKDPNAPTTGNSQVDQFLRQLQSRLLSSLAGQVNDAIFGDNPQQSGTITFGDQVITFVRLLDSVSLTITDNTTGAVTEISIPLLGQTTTTGTSGQILGLLGGSGDVTLGGMSGSNLTDPLTGLGSLTGQGDLTPGGF
jgi:curli production assembly/transport component CsgF